MEQIIEVKLDVPDGFEFVRWGKVKKGDWIMTDEGRIELIDWDCRLYDLIFKKVEPEWQPQIGDSVEWKLGVHWYPGKVIDQTEDGGWVIYDKDDMELYEVDRSEVRPPRAKQWKLVGPEDVGQKVFHGLFNNPQRGGHKWAEDPETLRYTLTKFQGEEVVITAGEDDEVSTVPANQVYIFK